MSQCQDERVVVKNEEATRSAVSKGEETWEEVEEDNMGESGYQGCEDTYYATNEYDHVIRINNKTSARFDSTNLEFVTKDDRRRDGKESPLNHFRTEYRQGSGSGRILHFICTKCNTLETNRNELKRHLNTCGGGSIGGMGRGADDAH